MSDSSDIQPQRPAKETRTFKALGEFTALDRHLGELATLRLDRNHRSADIPQFRGQGGADPAILDKKIVPGLCSSACEMLSCFKLE